MKRSFFFFFACVLSGTTLFACNTTPENSGVTAMNLETGESKDFANAEDVPSGWVECAEAGCPTPYPCPEILEEACLVRADCAPLYADDQSFEGCINAAQECDPVECGPQPGAPAFECEDGSIGGNTGRCIQSDEGMCYWEFRDCPVNQLCDESECGPPLGMPTILCDDGSVGGATGRCLKLEVGCGWEVIECPAAGCTEEECGTPPGMPNWQCEDGSVGGPVCEQVDGACGWQIHDCP
ncbi:MAG: hypothetical protein IPK82_14445 [Polyangiaceae bacterium]|nr:hypothetical protein [Polyangiaceae bacterium]